MSYANSELTVLYFVFLVQERSFKPQHVQLSSNTA
jgi:hypothetical protein